MLQEKKTFAYKMMEYNFIKCISREISLSVYAKELSILKYRNVVQIYLLIHIIIVCYHFVSKRTDFSAPFKN